MSLDAERIALRRSSLGLATILALALGSVPAWGRGGGGGGHGGGFPHLEHDRHIAPYVYGPYYGWSGPYRDPASPYYDPLYC